MRRTAAVLGFLALVSAAAVCLSLPGAARAVAGEATFLIPASDGYGVAECLTNKSECGQVIAHAWCEAQGYAQAQAYGVASPEDVTGAIETVAAAEPSQRPIAITCGN